MSASFSRRIPWPTTPTALATAGAELAARGAPLLSFSESNPTKVGLGLPSDCLAPLAAAGNLRYAPDPRGLRRAREALVADYERRAQRAAASAEHAGRSAAPAAAVPAADDLFLCSSTSEAYGWLFKLLCDPGDAVLVPKPGYPLFDHLAALDAVEARPYRLEYVHPGGWSIDLDSLARAFADGRARALILINPNNPTGSYVRPTERRAVIELCRRHGCALIVDEVFYDFTVDDGADDGDERSSFVAESEVLCFVLDGLSKRLGLPQMKLGWIVAGGPPELLREAEARLEIVADAYLSAATPIMNALPELLARSDEFVVPCRARLAANLAALRDALEGPESPLRVLSCEGGWTALIEVPRLAGEEQMALELLRSEGLLSLPGHLFDIECEAFFTAGLILSPSDFARGTRAFNDFFKRLCNG